MINNDYNRSLTTGSAFQTNNSVTTNTTNKNQSHLFLNNGLTDSKDVTNSIMSLVQQLLSMLQKGGGGTKPDRTPTLNLTSEQEAGLKNLLGFSTEAVGVKVLDRQRDKALSAGDVVVISGGITGGEITRHTLTQKDIDQLNGNTQLPQDLIDSRAKWDAATSDAQSVSYTAQNSCFCPPDYTRPMNITEQNGRIIDATYADTGEAVPSYIRDGLLTMNERFDQLEEAYLSGADRVDVSYDPSLGYPSSVYVDQSFMMADEELSYTIKDLAIAA